ncbi:MAG: AAA family ATPase, partial [Candidatus Heimdallarchaeaceae archaeon]
MISLLREIRQSFAKDGIQKFLRKRISPLITEKLQEYLDYFNLNISSITIDENFDLSFFSSAGNIPIKSMSGGEKVAIAIALRLAIA